MGEAASQLTPTQMRLMREHRERQERFRSLAKPDTPIICLSASARSQRADVPPAVLLEPMPLAPLAPHWFWIIEDNEPRPTVALIQQICGAHYNISVTDMKARRRLGLPRQVPMFLSKEFTLKSLPEIARYFGGRDHATVHHAIRKITKLESQDRGIADELNLLRQRIRETAP